MVLYHCAVEGCGKISYKYKKARDNHEETVHGYFRDKSVKVSLAAEEVDNDYILNYQMASLSMNLMIRNVNDAIREGDGLRLIETYKLVLLFFKKFGRTKYAFTLLKLFTKIRVQPETAFNLIWNRFVNTRGLRGRNIPLDLKMEHNNGFLKELLRNLRSNLNESNAARVAQTMKNLQSVIKNYEKCVDIKESVSGRNKAKYPESVAKLAEEYVKAEVYSFTPGREHESFPKFEKNLLLGLDSSNFHSWMRDKVNEFTRMYELMEQ